MHYACMEMENRNGEVGERGCGMVAWQMGRWTRQVNGKCGVAVQKSIHK